MTNNNVTRLIYEYFLKKKESTTEQTKKKIDLPESKSFFQATHCKVFQQQERDSSVVSLVFTEQCCWVLHIIGERLQ